MLEQEKTKLINTVGWDSKLAFEIIDSQKKGIISHANLFGFLFAQEYDAKDEELISMIRRT